MTVTAPNKQNGSNTFVERRKSSPQAPAVAHKRKSTFTIAVFIFLALNAWLAFYSPLHFDPYRFNYHGWDWWIIDDLRKSSEVHNVALLGSSTMVSAVAGCDANFTNKVLDLTQYHKSAYLDSQLNKTFGGYFRTYNLSAPGQMPSDAYLQLKTMVSSVSRPDIVIYGIAPRDFIDSTLSGPNDTAPFKYLTRIVNIDEVAGVVFRSPFTKLDWCLQKLLYLYNYGLDFKMVLGDKAQIVINKILPRPFSSHPFTWWDRMKLLPAYMPAEIVPDAIKAGPIDLKTAHSTYKDNTPEYQQRYKNPDPHTYKTQIYFLEKMAQYCHKEGIDFVLVNMPITQYNIGMLRPGIYMNYVQHMQEFAIKNDITFFNLCDLSSFHQEDFHDSVHLNAFGGTKFFDHLVQGLKQDKRSATAVSLSGYQNETRRAVAGSKDPNAY